MSIGLAASWTNFFFYSFESEHIKQVILNGSSKAYKYHGLMTFFSINDGNEFLTSFENISPKELQLKVQHQENHASFSGLHIKKEDSVFVNKLLDKRDKLPYFIDLMPHFSSNIPSTLPYIYYSLYGSIQNIFQ